MKQDKQFKFNYKKYKSKHISVDRVDQMIDLMLLPIKGYIEFIMRSIQVAALGILIWIRKNIIEEQMQIEKQEYEQGQTSSSKDELSNETLDNR